MKRRHEEALQWMACAITLLVVWGFVISAAYERAKLHAREQAHVAASNAKGFAEYLSLHLLALDKVLVESRDAYLTRGVVPPRDALASSLGPMAPVVLHISFTDSSGNVTASSLPLKPGLSIADRPHFLAFRDDPHDRPLLSQAVVGRLSERTSLQLVRPLLGPGGRFLGIAVASIDPLQFDEYFGSLDAFAGGGTVVIAGSNDGIVRARFGEDGMTWGQSLKESASWPRVSTQRAGTYEARSTIDDAQRTVGFHAVEGFPVVVLVSSKNSGWLLPGMPLILALAAAFTILQLGYTRSRVLRLRAQAGMIARMQSAREREMEAARMKSRFMSSMSHELKTPLNTIVGFSELLAEEPHQEDAAAHAARIHASAVELQGMVDSLLEIARSEAGGVRSAEVDLAETVRALVSSHEGAARGRGIPLDLTCDIPCGKTVVADTDRATLVKVLGNMMQAYLKTTRRGGVQVFACERQGAFIVEVGRSASAPPATPDSDNDLQEALLAANSDASVKALGGSLTLRLNPDSGTHLTLCLPGARLSERFP